MMHADTHASLAIGFGCTSRATAEEVIGLIATVLNPIPEGTVIGTLDRRALVGNAVADVLGLKIKLFSAEELAEVHSITAMSERVMVATGTPSVAEASALACLGASAHLIVAKTKGTGCTCAVAASNAGARL